jgi:hypothetical protein
MIKYTSPDDDSRVNHPATTSMSALSQTNSRSTGHERALNNPLDTAVDVLDKNVGYAVAVSPFNFALTKLGHRNSPQMNTSKFIRLKLPWNEHLQKNQRGGPVRRAFFVNLQRSKSVVSFGRKS